MADIIQIRRGSAAYWTAVNPVLAQGEDGYELDTMKEKRGDGVTAWNDLPYKSSADSLFLGTYTSLINLTSAHPAPLEGSKANIDAGVGFDVQNALWDNNDNKWVLGGVVTGMQAEIEGSQSKPTPADADEMGRLDSTDANTLVKWTWANVKAALLTAFNSVYVTIANFLEENMNGTASENLTMTGTVNISLNGQAHRNYKLTGNVVATITNTPAVNRSNTRTYTVRSTSTETFGITNSTAEYGEFKNDGSKNLVTVMCSNTTTDGLEIHVFYSQPN